MSAISKPRGQKSAETDDTATAINQLNKSLLNKTTTLHSLKESLQQDTTTSKFELQKEVDTLNTLLLSKLTIFEQNKATYENYTKKINGLEQLIERNASGNRKEDDLLMRFNENLTLMNESIKLHQQFNDFEAKCNGIEKKLDSLLKIDFLEINEDDTILLELLQIHYELNELIKFEQVCKKLASVSIDDSAMIIEKFFGKMETFDRIRSKFANLLKNIIIDLIDFVRNGKFMIIVIFFKIIERDIKEDLELDANLKFLAKKQESLTIIKKIDSKNKVNSINGNVMEEVIAQEIIQGRIKTRLEPQNVMDFFVKTLDNEVSAMFSNLEETYAINTENPDYEVLNNLDWILNELYVVFDHLHRFAFPEFPLREIYFKTFYSHLNQVILKIIAKEPDFGNLVTILQLDQSFIKTFDKGFRFKELNWQSPSIIGDIEKDSLIGDYLSLLKLKMEEWFQNIHNEEVTQFTKRSKQPSLDENGNLWLLDLKNLYQMFIQQMDLCCEIGYIKIFLGCFELFTNLLLKRQRQWMDLISKEVKNWLRYNHKDDLIGSQKKLKETNADVEMEPPAGGLLEYIIAVTNDQMKGADFTVMIQDKYGQLISKKHKETIDKDVDKILDGFADVAKSCTNGLIDIIMDDLAGNLQLVLSSKWYVNDNDTLVLQTLNILQDYLQDLQSFMNEYVFVTFIENLIEEFVINYIQSLNYKPLIVKKKIIIGFKKDLEMIFKFFQNYKETGTKDTEGGDDDDDEEEDISFDEMLESKFRILEYFIDLICCPLSSSNIEDFELIWSNLVMNYYDCPISLVYKILRLRKEDIIDNSKIDLIIKNCESLKQSSLKRQKETSLDTNLVPTFVSKLDIKLK